MAPHHTTLPSRWWCLSFAFGALLHSCLYSVSSAFGLALLQHRFHLFYYRPPSRIRQKIRLHTPVYSSNYTSANEYNDETRDHGGERSLQQRFGRYLSVFKTASIAFSMGSLAAIISSMILLNRTFNYNPAEGISKSLSSRTTSQPKSIQIQKSVTLYRSILETLTSSYADDINTDEMLETSVDSMLSTLDPYTEYLSQNDLAKRKNLVGIGAFVMKAGTHDSMTLDGKSVSNIISGIPSAIKLPTQLLDEKDAKTQAFKVVLSLEGYAYDAGLRVGDELISIDGHLISSNGNDASTMPSLEDVRDLLVGVPGTKVKLQFTRPGVAGIQTIEVERKNVQFPSVPCACLLKQTNDGNYIGYIRLRRFGNNAGESMKAAILSLQTKASQESDRDGALKGLVIDLRDNSGGELIEAIRIASLFVPDGTYLGSSKGEGSMMPNLSYYSGKLDLTQFGYPSQSNAIAQDTNQQMIDPDRTHVVILTNKQTASASEFLAGVFQDLDLGVILGNDKETLGKGIGQRELPLPYGRALKLTYHEFYTPSGRCVSINRSKQSEPPSKVFYTVNGRTLNDRRGINVDIRIKTPRSLLNELLSSSGAYFKYSSQWSEKHPSAKFVGVDDEIYNDFQSFVSQEQRRGNLKLETLFDDKQILKQMELLSKSLAEKNLSLLARLKQQIVKDLLVDFESAKDIIQNELELNLLARDSPDSVLIKRGLKSDGVVREAVKMLESINTFDTILKKSANERSM